MYTGGDYDEASRESNWQVLADLSLEFTRETRSIRPRTRCLGKVLEKKNRLAVHTQYCCATLSD